ncbi:MAG: DivIVA domain-containing protein [Clostridia bacterium]|nr:DivIVA domain-containing protein [Clostridia bacterium]
MQITIEMIETKEFKTKPRGYDPQEVDEFLDAICDEMVRMMDQTAALQQQLAAAKAARPVVEAPTQQMRPVAPAPVKAAVPDADFREILEMAQKVKNETIAAAEAKAEEIIAKAREEAASRLDNLDVEKESLVKQVAALKEAAADYRAKFEALLQAQQEAIEKASDLF